MEELLQSDTAFDIFFETLDRVKNLKTFQEELRSGNETLGRKLGTIKIGFCYLTCLSIDKNLSREDQLSKLRSEVEDLDTIYKHEKMEFEKKEKLQNEAFNVSRQLHL